MGLPFEGFDFTRPQNIQKSAKDAFADLARRAPQPPPLENKSALGAWFNQYISPGMTALGHKVLNANGDYFSFENGQGRFGIDFGRGAGAPGGALAWQATDLNAPAPVLGQQAPGVSTAQGTTLGGLTPQSSALNWLTPDEAVNPFKDRFSLAAMLGGQ